MTSGLIFHNSKIDWLTKVDWSLNTIWTTLIIMFFGYFVGSFLLSRFYISVFRGGNNIFVIDGKEQKMTRFGTSTTSYFLGIKFGILQFFVDFLKPILYFVLFIWPLYYFLPNTFGTSIISLGLLAVFIGHCWPIYWKFKGGIGVATSLGILFLINWIVALIGFFVWFVVSLFSKDSGIASFFGTIIATLLLFFPWMMDNSLMINAFRQDAQFIYIFVLIVLLMLLKFYNVRFWKNKIKNKKNEVEEIKETKNISGENLINKK